MERDTRGKTWAIVLAAGEGSRMANLTRLLYGHELPKQFAALDSERTLLQSTMDRIAPIAPPERTVVVVSEAYSDLAAAQLRDYPGVEIVPQPLNLGTGPGILLPLSHVMVRDPQARVAIFPSDHHVRRAAPFVEATIRGLRVADSVPSGVALLGAAAERPAVDLGWIVRGDLVGENPDRAWRVHRFIEKPPEPVAMLLLGMGGLWNTMVVTGHAAALWRLARRHIPRQTRDFERYVSHIPRRDARAVLAELYADMLPADFSREVLQAAQGLAVVPVIDSGWFDCGTPERLLEWLKDLPSTPETAGVLARLQSAAARAARRPAAPAHAAA